MVVQLKGFKGANRDSLCACRLTAELSLPAERAFAFRTLFLYTVRKQIITESPASSERRRVGQAWSGAQTPIRPVVRGPSYFSTLATLNTVRVEGDFRFVPHYAKKSETMFLRLGRYFCTQSGSR